MLLWVKNGEFAGGGWRPKYWGSFGNVDRESSSHSPRFRGSRILGTGLPWWAGPAQSAQTLQPEVWKVLSHTVTHLHVDMLAYVCVHIWICVYDMYTYVCVCIYRCRNKYERIWTKLLHGLWEGGVLLKTNEEWKDCTKMPKFPDSCVQLPI